MQTKADQDFNTAVAVRDRTKFLSFIAETATIVGNSEMRGHDAILNGWTPFFDPIGPALTWEPTRAEVLVGGDVGYTVGSWVSRSKTPDGKTTESRGQYLTTWRKQKDGNLEGGLRRGAFPAPKAAAADPKRAARDGQGPRNPRSRRSTVLTGD